MKYKDPETTERVRAARCRSRVERGLPFLVLAGRRGRGVGVVLVGLGGGRRRSPKPAIPVFSDASQATAARRRFGRPPDGGAVAVTTTVPGERVGTAVRRARAPEARGTARGVRARRFRAAQRRLAARVSRQVKEVERTTQPVRVPGRVLQRPRRLAHGAGGQQARLYPDGGPRMDMSTPSLRNNGIDVVGFQEFEQSQYGMFTARASG